MEHASHPGNIYSELKNNTAEPDPSVVLIVGHWTCCWRGTEQSVPIGVGAECFGERQRRVPQRQLHITTPDAGDCSRTPSLLKVWLWLSSGIFTNPFRWTDIRDREGWGQDAYGISPTRKQSCLQLSNAPLLPHPSAAALHAIPQPVAPTDRAIFLLFSFFPT